MATRARDGSSGLGLLPRTVTTLWTCRLTAGEVRGPGEASGAALGT